MQLVGAVAIVALLAGGLLWFRTSSFVSVTRVELSGVSGADAQQIEAALTAAARRQSTMSASAAALEAAVARYRVVRAVAISTSFPHTMRIDVLEQLPVARLTDKQTTTAVAADGVVLGHVLAAHALPQIAVSYVPRAGSSVHAFRTREYLSLLGAASAPLLPLVKRLYIGAKGLTAKMAGGLLVYFGDASRPHAKWASLAAVLANPESKGAVYIDVRLPERPAAGMSASTQTGKGATEVSAGDPTSAALAESLAKAVNGESPIEPTSGSQSSATTPQAGATNEGARSGASGAASTASGGATTTTTPEAQAGGESGGGYTEGQTPSG
ncbi:MAG: cell division protein FtsQ/DivIB [Solirubrobacteraceae bacterium]